MSRDVTLDWPGVFAKWFRGERIAAGQTSDERAELLARLTKKWS